MNTNSPLIGVPAHRLDAQTSAALWSRISTAHTRRVSRRRWQRLGIGAALVVAVASAALIYPSHTLREREHIDWQARAQALELQLAVLQSEHAAVVSVGADDITSELDAVDQRLRSAYESGPPSVDVSPLWQRRSELLDTLLAARKQGLALTRI
ncbi:MAG: hypothetical protein E6K53_07170 [Gammaproteobacteria bacterium]|nr:MAG: hypothetical protein E6K53_07170 [Gammaproteobacteria bacterium]